MAEACVMPPLDIIWQIDDNISAARVKRSWQRTGSNLSRLLWSNILQAGTRHYARASVIEPPSLNMKAS